MRHKGYSVLELLMVVSVSIVISGAAIPLATNGVDRTRAEGAVRYVAGRMASARFEAVRRSAYVAIRFVPQSDGIWLRAFVDGNRNGVLSGDITRGLDVPITSDERLDHHFSGITFGILPNVTGLDPGQPFNAGDPVQIGSSTLLSFSPLGASTSGTLFIRGQRGTQFAVRILGATGRTRTFEFNFGDARWHRR
ncbi:MAG TPA: GspH/FimT family pseudopilin [Acidimicrobiia bacterium]|nr:GspH/FimT family pseudopilin [Acidimicrobiia bacterium]